MADSQLLKRDIEQLIELLGKAAEADRGLDWESTHIAEDKLLWDFVSIVYERSMEPCVGDICERLFRLNDIKRSRWYS